MKVNADMTKRSWSTPKLSRMQAGGAKGKETNGSQANGAKS